MAKSSVKKPRSRLSLLLSKWPTLATFTVIYIFILQYFGSYMLTKTTTTGGDLGSHWIMAQYLRNYLVPTGRLMGWYPHWMGGQPILQYYFVPPYFLMVLLGPLLTLEIAFKLVSAAWIFFTPIAFYYGAKGLGFERPGPEFAASLSLALTWLETVSGGNYAQWGGNVKSAMAGQFPYGISLAFAVLCIGLIWDGYHSKKRLILTAVVFSMVVLHHLYTAIVVGLAATFFILHGLKNRKLDGVFHLGKVFALGIMISAFWVIPSFAKLGWSMPPRDVFYGLPNMDWIFIHEYSIFYLIMIVGFSIPLFDYFRKGGLRNAIFSYLADLAATVAIVHMINIFLLKADTYAFYLAVISIILALQVAYLRKETLLLYLVYTYCFVFFMLYASQFTNLLYARFIPMIFAVYLLLTARALMNLTGFIKAKGFVPIIVAFLLILWLGVGLDDLIDWTLNSKTSKSIGINDMLPFNLADFKSGGKYQWYVSHAIKDAPGWLKWNYEGIEVKSPWPGIKEMYNYTAHLPLPGRLNYEYYDYGKLGTARIFEQSPAFSNRSVMESLLVESSTTFPFFYYMQKTVSETSWWPGFPIKIPSVINLKHGKNIYWVYNVQYYLVYSDTIKKMIKNESDFHYLTTIGSTEGGYFEIYSVNEDSHYADIPKREPVLVVTDYWRPFSFKWFDQTELDVPVVYTSSVGDYELDHFRIIVLNKTVDINKRPNTLIYQTEEFFKAVNASKPLDYGCSLSVYYGGELLKVNDSCVDKPLWIKIPYFPNWKTIDADRIYLASPNLMLVFPNKEQFTLYYCWLPSDIAGYVVTLVAFILVAYSLAMKVEWFNRRVHRPVIARLIKIPIFKKIIGFSPIAEKELIKITESILAFVYKNKAAIIVVALLLWAGVFALRYDAKASQCSSVCSSSGFGGYEIPAFGNVIDNYDMGSNNENQNNLRNLKCTAVCDETRKDFVYVSGGGYAEFTMHVKPNVENILSIRATDNQNCRQNDIYVDGAYIGEMYGEGEVGQRTNFDFKMPASSKSTVRVRIYHNTSKTGCYGFDVFSNQIRVPECSCMQQSSSDQRITWIFITAAGLVSLAVGVAILLYWLTYPIKSLRAGLHDRVRSSLKGSVLSKIQAKLSFVIKKLINMVKMLGKDKKKIILLVLAVVAVYMASQYISRYFQVQSMCATECQDKGFRDGYAPSKSIIDEIKFGWDYSSGYEKHNFVCTAVCDEQRRNYVYASGGAYIEFDMATEPGYENKLIFKAGNFNDLCRQNDVYIDGKYVGEIAQSGSVVPDDYEIKIPNTGAGKIRVRLDHNTSKTQCWGHDMFEARVEVPKCICS